MPQATLPVIYLRLQSPVGSSVPPSIGVSRAGYPQTMVYANLQLPVCTAQWSPTGWWSLTPPSHPYLPEGWRLFSSASTCCHQQLPFSEVGCPMLPGLSSRITLFRCCQRQAGTLFPTCKDSESREQCKIKRHFFDLVSTQSHRDSEIICVF